MKAGWFLVLVLAAGAFGAGCVVEVGPSSRDIYQSCVGGDTCTNFSTCLVAGFNRGFSGNICSQACSAQNCPFGGICVAGSTGSLCYRQCPTSLDSECLSGTVCRSVRDVSGATFNICVP